MRLPNTDLSAEATARLAEIIQRNDAERERLGLTTDQVVQMNLERMRELLRKRRAKA